MPQFVPRILRAPLACFLALLVTSSPSGAPGGPALRRGAPPQQEVPSGIFSWAQSPSDLGSVVMPSIGTGGWRGGPFALRYRRVPGFTSDPTREVIIAPPDSGHPSLPERFMVQYPRDWARKPFQEKAVVVAFHSYSVSEKQIFLDTDLPFECQRRGWMLIAPYGLKDTNFANEGTQKSLESTLLIVRQLLGYNHNRIYAVGFSMGGLNAVSYAMRHQDPAMPRFAAVVNHTGTVDMLHEYEAADAFLQLKLRNPNHFGASPLDDPFAYERVSPALVHPRRLVDPQTAPITGALHIPFYFHANLADPSATLLSHSLELKNYLSFRGATVYEDLALDPVAGHSWSTLPMARALDTVAQHELDEMPPIAEVFADREGRWLYTDLVAKEEKSFARYKVEVSPLQLGRVNSFRISKLRGVDVLRLRLRAMGLDPRQELAFEAKSADRTQDVFLLKGYVHPPSNVRVVRAARSSWSHNPRTRELRIDLGYRGGPAQVIITP